MKKLLVLFVALALACSASAATAKAKKKKAASTEAFKITWGVDLGPSIPVGDLGTISGMGYTLGVNAGFPVGPGLIVADIHYSGWGADRPAVGFATYDGGNFSAIDFTGGYKYTFVKGDFAPYGIGALGLRRATFGEFSQTTSFFGTTTKITVPSVSSTDVLVSFGGGCDVKVGSMVMYFEAAYQLSDFDSFPIKVGLRF